MGDNKKTYAQLITDEMGKTIKESIGEIEKCQAMTDYVIKHALDFLADEHLESKFKEAYVTYHPLGVILGIMPWNFPFWLPFKVLMPALVLGNPILLKHAHSVP